MSLHEIFLHQAYFGASLWSALGLFVTIGIAFSSICRLNATKPGRFITSEQMLYLGFAFWAVEAFTDLLFLQVFYGHDLAFGGMILLYLHSTYKEWAGDDCISDLLNMWRKDHRRRIHEVKSKTNFGRRATDRR